MKVQVAWQKIKKIYIERESKRSVEGKIVFEE